MKRFLFSPTYEAVRAVGFDLDGTLYDEMEFVRQVYAHLSARAGLAGAEARALLDFMSERWLRHGSSYPHIFREAAERFGLGPGFEQTAVAAYRSFTPKLTLPARSGFVLDKVRRDAKKRFLLTDGRERLQRAKIDALGIEACFDLVLVTGDRPKPDPAHGTTVTRTFGCTAEQVAFCGDREVDRLFAEACGFHFVPAPSFPP